MTLNKKLKYLFFLKNRIKSNIFKKVQILSICTFFLNLFTHGQNLVINPNFKLLPSNIPNRFSSFYYPLDEIHNVNLTFIDSNWCFPWCQLSKCFYLFSYNDSLNINSGVEFEIKGINQPENASKLLQGNICKTIPIGDTVTLSFNVKIRNNKKKYKKGIRILASVSNTPISYIDIQTTETENKQLLKPIKIDKSKNEFFNLSIVFISKIPINYFGISCITKSKKDNNYLYFSNFKLASSSIKSCNDFTH